MPKGIHKYKKFDDLITFLKSYIDFDYTISIVAICSFLKLAITPFQVLPHK